MTVPPLETFEKLKLKETLIRLRVPRRGYERLVVVSAVHSDRDIPQVVMDCPEGLTDVLATLADRRLNFEFTGEDEMGYRFSATGAHLQGNTFSITLPTELKRVQRRNDFRLTAPLGAVFYLTVGDQRKRIKMLDLSASGVSGILISIKNGRPVPPPFEIGQTMLNLKLELPEKQATQAISIRECAVLRVEDLPQRGRYRLAVAFTILDEEQQANLRKYLYSQQRQLLKIRQQRL